MLLSLAAQYSLQLSVQHAVFDDVQTSVLKLLRNCGFTATSHDYVRANTVDAYLDTRCGATWLITLVAILSMTTIA